MAIYRLAHAARKLGIAPITLKRWLLEGKVDEVNRDRNGWRIFTEDDLKRIGEYAQQLHPPSNPKHPTLFDLEKNRKWTR